MTINQNVFEGLIKDQSFELLEEYDLEYSKFKDYTNELFYKIYINSGLNSDEFFKNPLAYKYLLSISCLLSPAVATKYSVHFGLYCTTLRAIGTEKHRELLKNAYDIKNLGCFMMTELGHGSNL